MKETNFKCMYLIDHNLYKKAIINNNNNNSHDYNTTFLNTEYLGSDNNLRSNEIKCQNNTCNSDTVSKYTDPHLAKGIQDDYVARQKNTDIHDVNVDTNKHKINVGSQKNIISYDVGSQKNIISYDDGSQTDNTNSNLNTEEITTEKNIKNSDEKIDDYSNGNCQCMEISSTNDQESTHKTGSRKRKYDETFNKIDQSNIKSPKPKNIKINPISNENNSSDLKDRLNRIRYDIDWPPRKPKKHSTPNFKKPTKYNKLKQPIKINPKSNKNDYSDLQDRLNRIRNDIEWPPRKSKNNSNQHMDNMDDFVKKSSHIKNGRENIIYICTLCNQNFKRKKSLSRHMKNIHADFFSNFESKKRKLPKVFHTPNKKFKTDISRKRKSESGIKSNKRVKKELLCKFCNSFFKNSSSLKRHEKNIHDFHNDNMKGLKRERNDDVGGYKKRHKNAEKSSVTYDNYF